MSARTVDDVLWDYHAGNGVHHAEWSLLVAEIDALRAAVRDAHDESDPFSVTWIDKHAAVVARAKEAENVGTL